MKMHRMVALVGLMAAAGSAHAAGVGVRAGTTGLGADFAWSLAPTLSARIGYSAGSYSRDFSTSDVSYDGKVKLSNGNAFLDWSLLGTFRISAGVLGNYNKIDVNGTPTSGTAAGSGATLSGTIKWPNKAAPYVGVGWGNVAGAGVNFYFDLGVASLGTPKSSLSANCASLSAGQCSQLQGQLASEQAAVDDKIKKYKYLPVAAIGVTIGF